MAATPTGSRGVESRAAAAARWTSAAVCVAALHAVILWGALTQSPPPLEDGEPAGAVMIELAPLPVAPQVQPQDVAVGEQLQATIEARPTDEPDEPEQPLEPEPRPEPEQPPLQRLELPMLEEQPRAEAVLPSRIEPPEEPREEEKKEEPTEPPKPKRKPPPSKSSVQQTSAPSPSAVRSNVSAARSAGASSSSIATWRGSIISRLNRYKRHPGGGARGTAAVSFTINRSGRVVSVRLIRSSGNLSLDREALALPRRAGPFPSPPAALHGTSFDLSAPIHFRN